MVLFCFSSSHRTASFDVLEQLERHAPAIARALTLYSEAVSGWVILATCNRFEAYLDVDDPLPSAPTLAGEIVLDALTHVTGIDERTLRAAGEFYCEHAVAEHLFAVSSGLESVVIGEGEIAGQVRRALTAARGTGTVTSELERLFQSASRTARGVKKQTELMTAGRSLVRLGLELAESRLSDWAQLRILVIGTGKYAGATIAALRDRGAEDIHVYSPSGRAKPFALSHGVTPVPENTFYEEFATSELIITCSSASDYILTQDIVSATRNRAETLDRHLIIDLGLPRNVDPTLAQFPEIELLDLETITIHAPLADRTAANDARSLVGAAAAEFAAQSVEQTVTPALVALRTHVLGVVDDEIARARSRGNFTPETESALRHLAGVLLHTPSIRARELARTGEAERFIEGAAAVFGIEIPADVGGNATALRAVNGDATTA